MDTLRGNFGSPESDDDREYDSGEDETGNEPPPSPIGQDERRMQVRAYNYWASLLADNNFPSIEDLEPENLPDFGPYSVLLDFSVGIEDPAVQYLGPELAAECGASDEIAKLSDVPSRSLLSRITDHYMQILANQAPIGFEAEFVNQRGATILYRGILLPFSSDNDTIDFIYGVINWKEMADQLTTDELLLEIDQALEPDAEAPRREPDPVTDWADGPGAANDEGDEDTDEGVDADEAEADDSLPRPSFGSLTNLLHTGDEPEEPEEVHYFAALHGDDDDPQADYADADFAADADEDMGLHDCLAAARELAQAARSCEDRSRAALYAAVGRAYDFSLAAESAPEEFDELVAENGLTVQDRAPMTPVVKLVFGADYDKTRLTEYAAVLSHAHRVGIERGRLAEFLGQAEGGLKGVVQTERRLRREEAGKPVEPVDGPREKLARKLREIEPGSFHDIDGEGQEFALVMIRRLPTGEVVMLGEIPDDIRLVERAARTLLG